MSYEGRAEALNLKKKYGIAEKTIAGSEKKFLSSLSASDKIRILSRLADMCFSFAAAGSRGSFKRFLAVIERGRNEKITDYKRITKWLKTGREKNP